MAQSRLPKNKRRPNHAETRRMGTIDQNSIIAQRGYFYHLNRIVTQIDGKNDGQKSVGMPICVWPMLNQLVALSTEQLQTFQ